MNDLTETINILIADDHQMIIDGIKGMLQNEGNYLVNAEANDGAQAWEYIQKYSGTCRILLTDISMPIMNGTELCRKVKAKYPHIKVLILSMYSTPAVVKEAIIAEADGYILKNAGKDELLAALHRISENGTYFSQDVLPVIYQQYQHEKEQDNSFAGLSVREQEILKLIAKELTSEEIAKRLYISKKTVDSHRAHLLEKSNSKSTIGLLKFAIKNGLVQL